MKNLEFPPSLKQKDKVLIISPSGKIDKMLLKGMKERLTEWGLKVIQGKYSAAKAGLFAGTTKQRLADLQYGLDHKEIKAIFCSRGGYGAIQLLDKISLEKFKIHPKWIIGYSDITSLHCLLQKRGFASIHAPMARHFTMEAKDDLSLELLNRILRGESMHYIVKGHKYNKKGRAQGILRGGNLAVLQSLRNTSYDFIPDNTILYLEDVNESPNTVQRMFYNLKMSGVLSRLSGLILGQFTQNYTNKDICEDVYQAIHTLLKEFSYPICYNFPIGHVTRNYPLINGAYAKFVVNKNTSELNFG